jgi:hypothetical protein
MPREIHPVVFSDDDDSPILMWPDGREYDYDGRIVVVHDSSQSLAVVDGPAPGDNPSTTPTPGTEDTSGGVSTSDQSDSGADAPPAGVPAPPAATDQTRGPKEEGPREPRTGIA